jgi:ABC-type transport system substrate-binding protein
MAGHEGVRAGRGKRGGAGRARGHHLRGGALATIVVVSLLAAACGSSNQSSGQSAPPATVAPVNGGKLVMAVPADGSGWNPGMNEWAGWTVLEGTTMLEPLALADAQGNAQPWLAKSITPNTTYDVWTLKLQPGVTFHDGTPFDAEAVKANLDFLVSAPVTSLGFGGFKDAKVIDPLTIEIDLAQPWAAFPNSFLDSEGAVMMSPKALASPDHGSSHPVGTGPFEFSSWTPNQSLKVVKNPNYWRAGLPHLDSIEFRIMPDAHSAAQALTAADIDAFETTDASVTDQIDKSLSIAKDYKSEPEMLLVNTLGDTGDMPNPTSNLHLRRALALATDRKTIASSIGEGIDSPTAPFAPESQWGIPEDQTHYPAFDLEKAKAEVKAYEQDTGQSDVTLTITAGADNVAVKVVQQLQQMWQAAGITVKLQNIDSSSVISGVIVGKYQVAMLPLYTATDPDEYRYFWNSKNVQGYGKLSINMTGYTTPQMDQDTDRVRTIADVRARKDAYTDLVQQINDAATNIWLYWTPYAVISSPRVHGLDAAATYHVATFAPKAFLDDVWMES